MIQGSAHTDLRDARLVLNNLLDIVEWMLVADKKRIGPSDCKRLLTRIELCRATLSEETADGE